jgi:hypothetical protein
MAKTPARRSRVVPPGTSVKRPRGRPPRPGGPKSQAEVQRAYRARLAAAGKVFKLIDAAAIADLAMVDRIRERLNGALLQLELRDQDVARLESRNVYLERELKRVERHNLNILKELIELKKAAAPSVRARARSRAK